jgi:hypothetical protein
MSVNKSYQLESITWPNIDVVLYPLPNNILCAQLLIQIRPPKRLSTAPTNPLDELGLVELVDR